MYKKMKTNFENMPFQYNPFNDIQNEKQNYIT